MLLLLSPWILGPEFLDSDQVSVTGGDPPLADFEVFANYQFERGSAEAREARKGVPRIPRSRG